MEQNFTESSTDSNVQDPSTSVNDESTSLLQVTANLPLATSFPEWRQIIFVVVCIICVIGINGNLLTIIAFIINRKLREPTKYLLLNLAVIDFISSIASMDLGYFQYVEDGIITAMKSKSACLWPLWAAIVAIWLSLGGIILVTLGRLFSVVKPMEHRRLKSTRNVLKAILAMWVMIVLAMSLPLFGWENWKLDSPCAAPFVYDKIYFYLIYIIIPITTLILVVISNIIIAVVAIRSIQKTALASTAIQINALETSTGLSLPIEQDDQESAANKRCKMRELKATKIVLLVVGAFICLWVPYLIMACIVQSYVETMSILPEHILITFEISKVLLVMSFTVNPLIYSWLSKPFQETYLQILTCWRTGRVTPM